MSLDALVVGSGPNGLAAAVTLARAGLRVHVLEGRQRIGGGCRSEELTLPGYVHDVCAAVHPMGFSSPLFSSLGLGEQGLCWIQPEIPLAHPLDDGTAVVLHRSIPETAEQFDRDGPSYHRLLTPLVRNWEVLVADLLKPPARMPRNPLVFGRFGLLALQSARALAERRFQGPRARALLAGIAGHGIVPLESPLTAGFALSLAAAGHAAGWPLATGGSQALVGALAGLFRSLGGTIETGSWVEAAADLPAAPRILFDLAPRNLVRIAGRELPAKTVRRLLRFRHGPGVFKLDWALSDPIPWRDPACRRAGTLHLGGSLEEIAAAEQLPWRGEHPERPFVILVQPTLWDTSRAPAGRHVGWAYCHVPAGSSFDMTARIEAQVERFAPGFRQCILARSGRTATAMEADNPNYIGGDISGGVQDLGQTFVRPVSVFNPYALPHRGWYLCSASAPPGGGVHGMCGYHAARTALRQVPHGRR